MEDFQCDGNCQNEAFTYPWAIQSIDVSPKDVSVSFTGLSENTMYVARVVITNSLGVSISTPTVVYTLPTGMDSLQIVYNVGYTSVIDANDYDNSLLAFTSAMNLMVSKTVKYNGFIDYSVFSTAQFYGKLTVNLVLPLEVASRLRNRYGSGGLDVQIGGNQPIHVVAIDPNPRTGGGQGGSSGTTFD